MIPPSLKSIRCGAATSMDKESEGDALFLAARPTCPCIPCADGSMSSIESSGVDTLFSPTDVHHLCYAPRRRNSEHIASDDELGMDSQRRIADAGSSGNLISLDDASPACSLRVKFMCSFGGRIMPRPSDGKLRYVGGETRLVTVNRDTTFADIVTKLSELADAAMVLKYQVPDEDLDALVSVCNDEDLENMMDEYDRLENSEGSPRLRVFLFPAAEYEGCFLGAVGDSRDVEQQYVDAVNGVFDLSSRKEGPVSNSNSNDLIGLDGNENRCVSSCQGDHLDFLSLMHAPGASRTSACTQAPSPLVPRFQPLVKIPQGTCFHDLQLTGEAPLELEHQFERFELSPQEHYHFKKVPSGNRVTAFQEQHADSSCSSSFFGDQKPENSLLDKVQQQDKLPVYVSECLPLGPLEDLLQQQQQQQQPSSPMQDEASYGGQAHRESFGPCMQRPPHFQNHVCMPYHMVSAPSACLGFSGRCMCLSPQYQVHGQLYGSQQCMRPVHACGGHCGAFHPCCFDHSTDGRPLWWRHCQSCVHCNLFLQGQLAPLLQGESGARPMSGLTSVCEGTQHSYNNEKVETRCPLTGSNPNQRLEQGASFGVHIPVDKGGPQASEEKKPDLTGGSYSDSPSNLFPVSPSVTARAHYFQQNSGLPLLISDNPVTQRPTTQQQQETEKLAGSHLATARELDNVVVPKNIQQQETDTQQPDVRMQQFTGLVAGDRERRIDVVVASSSVEMVVKPGDASARPGRKYTNCLGDGLQNGSLIDEDVPKPPITAVGAESGDQNFQVSPTKVTSALSTSRVGKGPIVKSLLSSCLQSAVQAPLLQDNAPPKVKAEVAPLLQDNAPPKANAEVAPPHAGQEADDRKDEKGSERKRSPTLQLWQKPDIEVVCKEKSPAIKVEDALKDTEVLPAHTVDTQDTASGAEKEAIARGLQTIKNGDLEEIRQLGTGTFGTVFYGKWRGSDVAIKRIKPSCFAGRPGERDRLIADFWREACTLGQLHHPNVVAFYGVVPDGPDGTLATVTEYMVNGSLKQVLQRKDRTIDRRKRQLIAMDAAFGMEYLHEKKIVHFDLKCENLLVNMRDPHRPICKVGDFGLSKVKHQTMVSGGVRGTLPWMAPELLNGSSSMVTEKVDIFSFGIVMWELLTGEEPYANMHYGAIIGGIVSNTLRPIIPSWCDPAWKSLMQRCWAPDPAQRPSFSEVASDLRAMTVPSQPRTHNQGLLDCSSR